MYWAKLVLEIDPDLAHFISILTSHQPCNTQTHPRPYNQNRATEKRLKIKSESQISMCNVLLPKEVQQLTKHKATDWMQLLATHLLDYALQACVNKVLSHACSLLAGCWRSNSICFRWYHTDGLHSREGFPLHSLVQGCGGFGISLCAGLILGEPLHTTVFIYSAGGKRGSSVLLESLNIICHAHAPGFSLSCTNTDTLQALSLPPSASFELLFLLLMLACIHNHHWTHIKQEMNIPMYIHEKY